MFWDRELPGFGVRVHPSGRKVYVAQTRARGKAAKRVTVGVHGVLTAEEARRRAVLIIARIKAGEEPVPEPMAVKLAEGPKIAEIAERYLEEHVAVRCKPKTASMYRLVVEKYIVPRLGKRPALAVGHKEVTELHHALSAKPIMANHVVDTLSRIYNAAEDRGQIPEASNPCPLVVKYRERKRDRFLTDEEFRRLGRVLDESETCKGVSVHAVAAMRLLLLTGCRKGEILNLLWDQVDMAAGELRLPDTKTGGRAVLLAPSAVRLLTSLPHDEDNPWVIAGRKPDGHLTDLQHPWRRIRACAGLDGVRIHDLRHSCATRTSNLLSLLTIFFFILIPASHSHRIRSNS